MTVHGRICALMDAFLGHTGEDQAQILARLAADSPGVAIALALACRQALSAQADAWLERAGRDAGFRAITQVIAADEISPAAHAIIREHPAPAPR